MPRDIRRDLGDRNEYTPTRLAFDYPEDAVRKEYMRMRNDLRRNIARIEKSGQFPDAQVLRTMTQFPPQSKLDREHVAFKLAQLETVLSRNESSLSGLLHQRREAVETLQDRGYSFITKANYNEFAQFMNSTEAIAFSILKYEITSTGQRVGEDRNKRLEMFNTAKQKGISISALTKDFRFFAEHLQEIKQLPDRKSGRLLGSRAVKNRLGMK